jgi:tetratricopeptide (TPR) repeat protein
VSAGEGQAARLASLERAVQEHPMSGAAWTSLGEAYGEAGQHELAVTALRRATHLGPSAWTWFCLSYSLEQLDEGGPALEAARNALALAPQTELEDWMKIRAAQIHEDLGDLESAGRLAAEVIPSLADRLAKMKPANLDSGDVYWSVQLAGAWRLVGDAAVAAGDEQRAEKYLNAAWRLQFLPEAGWALGDLREKQGRLAEAVELWSMAAGAASPTSRLPLDRQKRIAAACAKLPEVARPFGLPPKGPGATVTADSEPARQIQARSRLTELRTVRLKGPVVAKVTEDVVLLAAGDGRVERVVDVSRKSPQEFERQLARLDLIRVESPFPDDRVYKTVRRGLFTCSEVSGCALVLDLPNTGGLQGFEHGSIEFASLEPKAKVHYTLSVENSSIRLVVLTGLMAKPLVESEAVTLAGKEGDVTLTVSVDVPKQPGELFVILVSSDRKVKGSLVRYKTR